MNLEKWVYTVPLRLRSLFRRRAVEQELDEEIRYHIERQIEQSVAGGLTPAEARYSALRALDGIAQHKERCRDARRVNWIEDLGRDLRYAARSLWSHRGFTAVALCCLALGIGANTAIFSMTNAVMLKSLPLENPENLFLFRWASSKPMPAELDYESSGYGSMSLPYSLVADLSAHSRTLSDAIGFVPLGFNNQSIAVQANGVTAAAGGEMVTPNYFSGLGVTPIFGRGFNKDDEKPGAPSVAVISYSFWSRRFARAPSAAGAPAYINGVPFTIVGVTPPEFFGVNPGMVPDLWIPVREYASLTPWGVQSGRDTSLLRNRHWWWALIIGRVRAGVSEKQARAELDPLFQRSITAGLARQPQKADLPHLEMAPAAETVSILRMRFVQPLKILTCAVALVLLIACANIAVLLLARAAARLIRQLLTESSSFLRRGACWDWRLRNGAARCCS